MDQQPLFHVSMLPIFEHAESTIVFMPFLLRHEIVMLSLTDR